MTVKFQREVIGLGQEVIGDKDLLQQNSFFTKRLLEKTDISKPDGVTKKRN